MSVAQQVDRIIERSKDVLADGELPIRSQSFSTYAVSNFRGGIGKSTLSFNLAYQMSLEHRLLLLDTCSQRNFTQNMLGEDIHSMKTTVYNALVRQIAGTSIVDPEELAVSVKAFCPAFKSSKQTFMIPGSTELFLFPSLLYSTLAQYSQLQGGLKEEASARVIQAVLKILSDVATIAKPEKTLMDTSPFFGGATHLAWAAADALIIPVRVDQHSIEALSLTLKMLDDQEMDFHRMNKQAGLKKQPMVHAVVMTHCGWNRQKPNTPDSSTRFFVEKAVEIANAHSHLFSETAVEDCFYMLDDFHSSGRISGKQRIPLTKLNKGTKYLVDGQRMEVNPSVDRYKKEVLHLAAAL